MTAEHFGTSPQHRIATSLRDGDRAGDYLVRYIKSVPKPMQDRIRDSRYGKALRSCRRYRIDQMVDLCVSIGSRGIQGSLGRPNIGRHLGCGGAYAGTAVLQVFGIPFGKRRRLPNRSPYLPTQPKDLSVDLLCALLQEAHQQSKDPKMSQALKRSAECQKSSRNRGAVR